MAAKKETMQFQAEVRQLLDLMIHSLYSNKEIFLRELVSNASDANDKLRFEALSEESLYENDPTLEVRVSYDSEAGTVTVEDSGIGMTRDEVIANIGTIAQSGTKEFLKALSGDQAKDAHLIGQFGVGFYSAFIVADKVTLTTRKAGTPSGEAVSWESAGDGNFTLETVDRSARGTSVTLHLRDDEKEFLDNWRLRSIVKKFSDHISWPIMMEKPPVPPMGDEEGEEEAEDKEADTEVAVEWETINSASALWTRSKSEIKDEEYNEFYKTISHDFEEPLDRLHTRLEGNYEYTLLLYLPKRAPFDLWDRDRKHGVKLYVKRVFIMEGAEELLPRYLRFIRGVVDSADLPLNVSREILQKNKVVRAINKGLVGKSLGMLEDMAGRSKSDDYATFWTNFGMVLKEGIIEDQGNRERVAKLLRFASTTNDASDDAAVQNVTLEDYIGRMQEDQKEIYYVIGESHKAASQSPHLEIFRKKGVEVLLLSDRIDEWLISHLNEFDGKKLQAISKGDIDLGGQEEGEEDQKKREEKVKDFEDVVSRVKSALGDEMVADVRLSSRLTDSPSCLVGGENDMSAAMERLLREAGQDVPEAKRILELNPDHSLVDRLKGLEDETHFGNLSRVLFDQAVLAEGGQLQDPAEFVRRMNGLLLEQGG